jgi:hypothetical protein
MGRFSREHQSATVRGLASIVPESTGNIGSAGGEGGNFDNTHAGARVKSFTWLVAHSAEDGGPVDPEPRRVTCQLPNWLRMVMHDAGGHDGQSEHLPAELVVAVLIDATSRQIVELDVVAAETQLRPYRDIGTREWKETEAMLAPVRQAFKLPGMLRREVPAALSDWRKTLGELREDLRAGAPMRDDPIPPKELEQMRRTAVMLRASFQSNPKGREKTRKSLLEAGPTMAAGVAAGTYPRHAFAAWLMFNETSGALLPEEAAEMRRAAGLDDA